MRFLQIIFFFLLTPLIINGQYVSGTVENVAAPSLVAGSVNNPIIRVKIEVGVNTIDLYALFLSSGLTTNPTTNITDTRIFYTSSSTVFSTTTQYPGGTMPLPPGINYFWIAYDISLTALTCDTIDAECYTIYVSQGTQTPTVSNPPGFSYVGNCATGISENIENNKDLLIYPNPSSGVININSDFQKIEVTNSIGKIIYRNTFSEKIKSFDLSNLPKGIYFVRLENSHLTACEKLFLY